MKHPPYHLRINKSVDRLLLVDAIRALGPALGVVDFSEFTYHTLAGPFLEDLRVMTHFFPEMQMISIESDEQTHKRQLFNKFCSNVQLRKVGFSDYLYYDYEPGDKDIFWLDYTDLKYRRFTEFQQVGSMGFRVVAPTYGGGIIGEKPRR